MISMNPKMRLRYGIISVSLIKLQMRMQANGCVKASAMMAKLSHVSKG